MTEKSMMILKVNQRSADGAGYNPSFRLIPISEDCPFLAAEYAISDSMLIILHKVQKEELTSVPKVDQHGRPQQKNGEYLMDRRMISEWFETRVNDQESIVAFINTMAVNAKDSNIFMPYLSSIQFKDPNKLEKPSLITI